MPSAFAGGRRNASLDRSVSSCRGSFPARQTHRRQQVSSGKMRRGTSSACAKRTHSSRWRLISGSLNEDTSFARSRDPCTSIVTVTPEAQANGGGASVEVSRSGKPTKVGTNRQRDLGRRTNARLAACHRSSRSRATANLKRSCVMRQKRKVVLAIVPARNRESRAQCPYVVFQVAEVGRQHPGPE
jgi:hypothetical protein